MIRLSLIVTFIAAAIGVSLGVTALPRAKPDINSDPQFLPPVEIVPVVAVETPDTTDVAKLQEIEVKVRHLTEQAARIERKVETEGQ